MNHNAKSHRPARVGDKLIIMPAHLCGSPGFVDHKEREIVIEVPLGARVSLSELHDPDRQRHGLLGGPLVSTFWGDSLEFDQLPNRPKVPLAQLTSGTRAEVLELS